MPQLISNPIISGFSPDPSACAVGGLYFAVTSSFHFFPGIPIYVSKYLVTWSHLGNAINRREQLDLAQSAAKLVINRDGHTLVATGGLWAPTIRHHKDVFYITCTNTRWVNGEVQFRNFIIQTSDIWSNSWSDPIFFDFHGIDPNLFFDDDGRAYIQGSRVIDYSVQPSTTIDQFEIDVVTGQKLSELKTIWEGFIRVDAEGPRLYKRGRLYYLVIAEGGPFEHHLVSAARSQNVWGPYESAEINPILPSAETTSHFQQTGHPDIFQDAQGEWWATVLGVREKDGRCPMGRELLLTKVSWPTANDWPVLAPITPEIEIPESSIPDSGLKDVPSLLPKDAFLEIRNGPRKQYRSSNDGLKLVLVANPADLSSLIEAPAFLGLRQRKLQGTAEVHIQLDDQLKRQQFSAGLTLYKDENRFLDVHSESHSSSICFRVHNKVESIDQSTKFVLETLGNSVYFRMRYTEELYEFSYRTSNKDKWVMVGSVDSRDISGFDFTGSVIGVFAMSSEPDMEVTFSDFVIDI
ncbi:uncharacterized protein N7483_003713 [Penicillium malachiteum]|uniref:uncharacterized protein n=1 Tax=Penicillium malachiteum TaxID=1324776 RepID=UPI002548B25D|nr:uncharacterized protein N7483_003713 [Penicillium malachiteum]KAJ5729205.1 hypothetical protein N7483_003713 [Penicillium malachiteum]